MSAQIIITADDFGITPNISGGMVQLALSGKIDRLSLMCNMPGTAFAIELAKSHPEIIVGLHFNLTEQFSIYADLPGITDSQRRFYSRAHLLFNCLSGKVKYENVLSELEAQYSVALGAGLKLKYLDSHQHIHIFPVIQKACIDFARKKSIKIRVTRPAKYRFRRWFQNLVMRSLLKFYPVPENLAGNSTLSSVFDLNTNTLSAEDYNQLIPETDTGHIHEIMVHPYALDETLYDLYPGKMYQKKKKFLQIAHWEFEALQGIQFNGKRFIVFSG